MNCDFYNFLFIFGRQFYGFYHVFSFSACSVFHSGNLSMRKALNSNFMKYRVQIHQKINHRLIIVGLDKYDCLTFFVLCHLHFQLFFHVFLMYTQEQLNVFQKVIVFYGQMSHIYKNNQFMLLPVFILLYFVSMTIVLLLPNTLIRHFSYNKLRANYVALAELLQNSSCFVALDLAC